MFYCKEPREERWGRQITPVTTRRSPSQPADTARAPGTTRFGGSASTFQHHPGPLHDKHNADMHQQLSHCEILIAKVCTLQEGAKSILSWWGSCDQRTQLLSQLSHLLIEVSRSQACHASVSPLVEGITLYPFFAKEQQENHPSSKYPQSQAAGPPRDWLQGLR